MNAINFHRVANYCHLKSVPLAPKIIKFLIFIFFNSVIPAQTKIGKKSRFMYGGIGVVIHKNAVIGKNVAIGQGVTLGRKLTDGAPIIGDNVYLAAGSKILGNISIGNNVIVGANAVVIDNVPSNSIVAGIPARVVKTIDTDIYQILGDIL